MSHALGRRVVLGSLAVLAGLVATAHADDGPVRPYTWDNCIVCNKKLGSDGHKVVTIVYKNQELKANEDVAEELKKDPEKYYQKYVNASESKQKEWESNKPK